MCGCSEGPTERSDHDAETTVRAVIVKLEVDDMTCGHCACTISGAIGCPSICRRRRHCGRHSAEGRTRVRRLDRRLAGVSVRRTTAATGAGPKSTSAVPSRPPAVEMRATYGSSR